jgi:hypothetical protein
MTIDPNLAILRPVVVLVAWTIVMLAWLIATRIPAMKAAGVDLNRLIGGKGTDADGVLPAKAQWKAHNYNHLMEQPTLFYAIAIILVLLGQGSGVNAALAWAYVGLRVLHSLVQATWNRVAVRFVLFMLSSLALIALTLHAAIALFAG